MKLLDINPKIMNRVGGLAMAAFGGIVCFSAKDSLPLDIAGSLFMLEGGGDLISGRHHYVTTSVMRYLTKGKIDIRYKGDSKYTEEINNK